MLTYLNQGMYDVVEAARLVGQRPAKLVRWGQSTTRRGALVAPSLDGLYSFHDLISLYVLSQLVERGLKLTTIHRGIRSLGDKLKTPYPLAHQDLPPLATAGREFFAALDGEWLDVGQGWQGAFQEVLLPALRGVEYGTDRLAAVWRPAQRVWLNPRVQAGAACVEKTRVPTALVYELVRQGDAAEDVAADYDLAVEDVVAATAFEEGLRQVA